MNKTNRFITIMRKTTCIAFVFAFSSLAAIANSQNAKVKIDKNQTTIEKVIEQIEEQTDYLFVYSRNEINTDKEAQASSKETTVKECLDKALESTGINYSLKDNYIVLNKATDVSQQSTRNITGVILDTNGQTVIGANVVVKGSLKGTLNGTVTDFEGKFSMNVPHDAVLMISYIGYTSQEVAVSGKSSFNITMKDDLELLDEVVVVGYGSQTKVNLTGSVATISNKDLASRPITSVSAGIQGIVPGVSITSGQGRPGQDGGSIRVRGQGTLNNSSPYILIDGIESGSMDQVDPNDIESISILKDAASAAIYGSKAANGVILITTKRGKNGKPILSYSGNVGWQTPTGLVEKMNSADAASYYNLALTNGGKSPRFSDDEIRKFRDGSDPYNYPNTDWSELAFSGSGFINQHNVNISGGSEYVKYMTSAGYLGQEGLLPNSNRKQFNLRSNIDITLSERFTVHSNLAYINNSYSDPTNPYSSGGSSQILRQVNTIAPWITNQYEDGTYGTVGDGNPIAWLDSEQTIDRKNHNVSGLLSVDYNIMEGLKFSLQGTYVSNIQDLSEFVKDIQYNENKYHGPNELNTASFLWNRSSLDALLNYDKTFGKHTIKGLLGYRMESYNYKQTKASRQGFPNNDMTDMNAGNQATQTNSGYTRASAMMSYFGRVNYDYMGKYLFEANFRADGSSRFSPDNRWGYFPSLSAGWRISEEAFMESTRDWLQSLKLRGSWGLLGNQDAVNSDLSSDYYPWLATYKIGENYPFDGVVETGIAQTTQKLSTISWETTTTWGIGLDVVALTHFNLGVDYYNRETRDIIMEVPVPGSFGLSPYKDNVGVMVNRGIEITLGYGNSWKDWRFSANGNFALNRNEILDLGGVDEMIDDYRINRIGSPYRSFYGYVAEGLFQSQDEADGFTEKYGNPFGKKFMAGDIRYADANGDGNLTSADRDVFDSEQPKFTYGLNLSVGWKGFDLSMLFQGAGGVSRYFGEEVFGAFQGDMSYPATVWFDAWSPENKEGTFPYVSEGSVSASNPQTESSFWIFTTNYLRMKNLQLSYTLPSNWLKTMGVSNARIYYSGENLFRIDSLPINIDPESPSGNGSQYPVVMTNSFGLNLTF